MTPGMLAVRNSYRCGRCGNVRLEIRHDQPALFFHGGYGETVRTVAETCACGVRVAARESRSPREGEAS